MYTITPSYSQRDHAARGNRGTDLEKPYSFVDFSAVILQRSNDKQI